MLHSQNTHVFFISGQGYLGSGLEDGVEIKSDKTRSCIHLLMCPVQIFWIRSGYFPGSWSRVLFCGLSWRYLLGKSTKVAVSDIPHGSEVTNQWYPSRIDEVTSKWYSSRIVEVTSQWYPSRIDEVTSKWYPSRIVEVTSQWYPSRIVEVVSDIRHGSLRLLVNDIRHESLSLLVSDIRHGSLRLLVSDIRYGDWLMWEATLYFFFVKND